MAEVTGFDKQFLIDHWKRVGPLLEARRNLELRGLSDREAYDSLASLGQFALEVSEARVSTGLIEMRRLFDSRRDVGAKL
ncbi:MAG: hypothetical protein NT013_12465 [Planctomycetia bacterium]|nr:hypothetical protein [Planctomycetia bacterium]